MKENKRKYKILLIIPLPPPIHGVTMANDIIKNCKDFNFEFDTKFVDYSFVREINEIGGFSMKKGWIYIKHLVNTFKTVFKFKPDVIYFTIAPVGGAFIRDAIFVNLLKLFFNKRVVLHFHGKGIYKEMKKSKALSFLYNLTFSNTYIILLSNLLKNDLKLVRSKHNLFFIPNGIKPIKHKGIKQSKLNPIKLLYLSNLIESKGVIILLKAISQIVSQGYDNFSISFVGKPSKSITETIFNQEVEKYNLNKHVNYLGPKYGDEKYDILKNSDIFVFPTYKDCFPLVLLEAMQSKLAIISTYEGAIPEIIDNNINGILCRKKSVDDLVLNIIKLLENPELINKLGDNAYEKFEKHYTAEKFESRLIKTFNEILQKDEFRG
ncbi:MAG: glycosyltransferase family 4 protein [Bacteroidetes bacterium]|nr:glycosyltransferase family 4 protein [Bacteroidota bacterium]MDA0860307.1 glycosyltransferase family 4 protein [Bacteroidota bacterium]MDA1318515.1 glycosyltransferase family 4 protein [Bacteroidota bacterium]